MAEKEEGVPPPVPKSSEKEESAAIEDDLRKSSVGRGFFASSNGVQFLSAWVVDLERQEEGYTAGRGLTYCAMLSGMLLMYALTIFYLLTLCTIKTDLFEEGGSIGYGAEIISTLVATGAENRDIQGSQYTTGTIVQGFTFLGLVFIYIADVLSWSEHGPVAGFISKIIILAEVVAVFVTALLLSNGFPASPYFTFIVFTIGCCLLLKSVVFPTVQKLYYQMALIIALIVSAIVMFFFQFYSTVVEGNYFSDDTLVEFHQALDCPDDAEFNFTELLENETLREEFFANQGELSVCDEAFLVYAGPGIFFLLASVFAGVLFFLYRAEKRRIESKKAVGIEPLAQVFLSMMLLSILGLWVAASIASATAAVSDAILSLSFVSLALMLGIAVAVFGIKYLDSQIKKTSMGKKGYEFLGSDWGKGLLVITSLPIILGFFALDALKHFVRKHSCLGKAEDEEDKKRINTKPVAKMLAQMALWEKSSVITKALIWGIFYFVFSVGVTRITVVFLSYMRETIAETSLAAATLILCVIGLIMFLLPPVPGVPVYITLGVILPTVAQDENETNMSLFGAIMFVIAIALALKLFALVLQQKAIGEWCGSRSVAVRHAVGVNSVELRAMRKILKQKGLAVGKVAILIGGPDWPTSVLTGIMKLNVFEMMIGTTPVVFLIAPCVVSGAMLVEAGLQPDNELFTSLNTIFIFLMVVVQSASMLVAAQVLANAAVKYEDELKAEEPDKEVLELTEKNAERVRNYKIVTSWDNLSTAWKVGHVISLFLMISCSYAFQLFGADLFITFDVTNSIGADLDGNALNIVQDIGWVFIGMFTLATIYYIVFTRSFKGVEPSPEMLNKVKHHEVIVETKNVDYDGDEMDLSGDEGGDDAPEAKAEA